MTLRWYQRLLRRLGWTTPAVRRIYEQRETDNIRDLAITRADLAMLCAENDRLLRERLAAALEWDWDSLLGETMKNDVPVVGSSVQISHAEYENMRQRIDSQERSIKLMERAMEDLRINARRYSVVRAMNVREFAAIYVSELDGDLTIDAQVDKILAKGGGNIFSR